LSDANRQTNRATDATMLKLPTMSWSPIKTVIAVDAALDPVLLQYVSIQRVSPLRWCTYAE